MYDKNIDKNIVKLFLKLISTYIQEYYQKTIFSFINFFLMYRLLKFIAIPEYNHIKINFYSSQYCFQITSNNQTDMSIDMLSILIILISAYRIVLSLSELLLSILF